MTPWRDRLRALGAKAWAERLTGLGLAGAAAVVAGIAQIYGPAAWIVAGSGALFTAWRLGRQEAKP